MSAQNAEKQTEIFMYNTKSKTSNPDSVQFKAAAANVENSWRQQQTVLFLLFATNMILK